MSSYVMAATGVSTAICNHMFHMQNNLHVALKDTSSLYNSGWIPVASSVISIGI